MAYLTFDLMSDAVGLPIVCAGPGNGVEIPNNASRRRANFSQGVGLAELQWSLKEASQALGISLDVSVDNGVTWAELIPPAYSNGISNAHQRSDRVQIPTFVAAEQDGVLVRAKAHGPLLGTQTLTFITLVLSA